MRPHLPPTRACTVRTPPGGQRRGPRRCGTGSGGRRGGALGAVLGLVGGEHQPPVLERRGAQVAQVVEASEPDQDSGTRHDGRLPRPRALVSWGTTTAPALRLRGTTHAPASVVARL